MSLIEMNGETAVNVLILWLVGADGSICYDEKATIKRILDDLDHHEDKYYQVVNYLSGLGTKEMSDFVEDSIAFIQGNFSKEKMRTVLMLSEALASAAGNVVHEETQMIERLKEAFDL